MNKNIKKILKQKLIINSILSNNYTRILKKSISQNNNILNSVKIYNNYTVVKTLKFMHNISRKHKICLLTGKYSPIIRNTTFSRYTVKNIILSNNFTNLKKHNW